MRRKPTRGFLLNHLIAELLPEREGGYRFSNSDPITGQAAWYDLRVSIEKAAPDELGETWPRFEPLHSPPPLAEAAAMTSLPETTGKEARAGDRSRHLRRLPGLRHELQGMERRRLFRAADRPGRPTAATRTAPGSTACTPTRSATARESRTVHFPRSCLHCETPACVTVCPTGASYKRAEDGIVLVNPDTCIGCKLCSWACPYGAREYDYDDGVMKKCTLCVDRIYNETFAPEDRIPACVRACPTGARHFGDLGDPDSAVSQLVKERGGFDLLPEMGYKPVNKYLPPRPRRDQCRATSAAAPSSSRSTNSGSLADRFFAWADKTLAR